jgi:hypothetical protein
MCSPTRNPGSCTVSLYSRFIQLHTGIIPFVLLNLIDLNRSLHGVGTQRRDLCDVVLNFDAKVINSTLDTRQPNGADEYER